MNESGGYERRRAEAPRRVRRTLLRLAARLLAPGAFLAAPAAIAQVACEVDAAPLNFGVYDTLSTADNRVTGSVTVSCWLLDPNAADRISYSISLGPGSGSYARRTMRAAAGPDALAYNVYLQNASPATVWGDGTAGTVTASGSMTINKNSPRRPLVLPAIGIAPAGQIVAPGVYGDTLTVTVTWN